jgi:hypothetical protein
MKKAITLFTVFCLFTYSVFAQQISLPYFDDFETGAPGWTTSADIANGTTWELGIPSIGFTLGAFSGDYCWDVNLNSNYYSNATCYLNSPIFDFTYVTRATVSFWTMYHSEYLWDYLAVQVSVDRGDSWQYLPFPHLINPDGGLQKWIRSEMILTSLNGFSSVQFRMMFVSDGSINYDGYSVDDFRIDIDPLGVEAITPQAFSFYPNPATDKINFSFENTNLSGASVIITDMQGKTVLVENPENLQRNSLPLRSLDRGVYTVIYADENGRYAKNLVVTGN